MGEHFFDDLAKGLDDGSVSRRRALKLVGGALLAVVLPPLFPKPVLAITKKKCKRVGGIFQKKGNCHCAQTCSAGSFACGGNNDCRCLEKAAGGGFCGDFSGTIVGSDCLTKGCPSGQTCIVMRDCANSGDPCTTSALCPSGMGCVNNTRQFTTCPPPP
jgi:hypothetical protein